jgi:hypothetical protein
VTKNVLPPTRTKLVLIAFVILALAPFVYAATHAWFWQHQHSMAPIATALYLLVVAALVLGRFRWAWVLLALFYGAAIVGWVVDSERFAATHILSFGADLAVFALLVSPTMRHRLRRPLRNQARRADVTQA